MPSFVHPLYLALLLLVPPILWHWRKRGRATLRFSNTALLSGLPRGRSVRALWAGLLLRGVGLCCVIVGLAGPRWPDAGTRLPTEGIAIAMVVDVSASMNTPDFLWQNEVLTRLEGVQKVFHAFVAGGEVPSGDKLTARPQDLISLITFATRPETACPLTLDHAALLKVLDAEAPARSFPRQQPIQGTPSPGRWNRYVRQRRAAK